MKNTLNWNITINMSKHSMHIFNQLCPPQNLWIFSQLSWDIVVWGIAVLALFKCSVKVNENCGVAVMQNFAMWGIYVILACSVRIVDWKKCSGFSIFDPTTVFLLMWLMKNVVTGFCWGFVQCCVVDHWFFCDVVVFKNPNVPLLIMNLL